MSSTRSLLQNRKFSAIVSEVAAQLFLFPYRRAFVVEAWRRYLIAMYVREARLEAKAAGGPDPFPVRPVPSSGLDSRRMSELIECATSWCVQNGVELKQ